MDNNDNQRFKADAGKPDPTLLERGFAQALALVQATLDYGAQKYEPHSWRRVPDNLHRYDAAARRHRNARDQGEVFDSESGLPHLAHEIICNLMLLQLLVVDGQVSYDTSFNPPPQDHKE